MTTPGTSGTAKHDVKVFRSSIDTSSVSKTIFSQPTLYMGIVNLILMYATQRFPEEFMTPKYMTMSYNGVRARAMLTIPFCCIGSAYFAVASIITKSSSPLAGHLLGYGVSLGVGLTMMTFRRVSWYYPLLGLMYLSFGGFHHYRRMMVYGDNAPIYNWGDLTEIWSARRQRKLEGRKKHEAKEVAATEGRN
ncbi:uncharacterized protein TEOVI_000578500 [Trypanosoma equiperdum]|uniref:Uncharacterized protein n=2 Tax=Trypanozoon TaxID=39700 RepID=Q38C54_TRYB2|nr:hypothetical protein, conserved [Trypanosoma brucei brucei TREU927]EAN77616.1 hypothetical protein, conserved [Trypanosoma brucei brucei TREU927]SCU66920.1 hypothetical protein, conserved [Trypanosoma equiperdum]